MRTRGRSEARGRAERGARGRQGGARSEGHTESHADPFSCSVPFLVIASDRALRLPGGRCQPSDRRQVVGWARRVCGHDLRPAVEWHPASLHRDDKRDDSEPRTRLGSRPVRCAGVRVHGWRRRVLDVLGQLPDGWSRADPLPTRGHGPARSCERRGAAPDACGLHRQPPGECRAKVCVRIHIRRVWRASRAVGCGVKRTTCAYALYWRNIPNIKGTLGSIARRANQDDHRCLVAVRNPKPRPPCSC